MYCTYNESKSVIAKRFLKTLKAEVHKKMTANNSKSYLSCLNQLVDQYNNIYHQTLKKKKKNHNQPNHRKS